MGQLCTERRSWQRWMLSSPKIDSFLLNERCGIKAEDSEVSISAAFYLFTSFVCVVKGYCTHYYWATTTQAHRSKDFLFIPDRNKEDGSHITLRKCAFRKVVFYGSTPIHH